MPKHETEIIGGKEFKIVWEVVDDTGRVIEETISEEWANDIINDSGKHDEWFINDRLEEV